jgi:hypothetical protein
MLTRLGKYTSIAKIPTFFGLGDSVKCVDIMGN